MPGLAITLIALGVIIVIGALSAVSDRWLYAKYLATPIEKRLKYRVLMIVGSIAQVAIILAWYLYFANYIWFVSLIAMMLVVGYVKKRVVFYGFKRALRYLFRGGERH